MTVYEEEYMKSEVILKIVLSVFSLTCAAIIATLNSREPEYLLFCLNFPLGRQLAILCSQLDFPSV